MKSYLKKTFLWKVVSKSSIYLRLKNPVGYQKSQEEPRFYRKLLKIHPSRNDLIFDVGANIGSKSLIFSKLAKKVIAFEPSEKLFLKLKKKFENKNIIVYPFALGESSSKAELYIIEKNEAYNSLKIKHLETTVTQRGIARMENVTQRTVEVKTLESFIAKYGLPKLIKIDVEGYEFEVLKGLQTRVPIISFEANLPDFRDETILCLNYLDNLSSSRYRFNFTTSTDFLENSFISKDEAIKFIKTTKLLYLEIYAVLK